jgi:hypothetical protein
MHEMIVWIALRLAQVSPVPVWIRSGSSAMRFRTTRTSSGDLPTPVVGLLGVLLGLTLLAFWFDQHVSVSVASRADALMVVIRHEGDQVTFEAHENVGRLWSTPGVTRAVSTLLLVTIHGDALLEGREGYDTARGTDHLWPGA